MAWDDLVKGYEYEKGRFVVLTKEDFQAAALEKSRTVDILDFVKAERDRRSLLRDALLRAARQGRRARVRPAARGNPDVGPHRHREDHPARDAAPRCAAGDRRGAGADHDAVRRRARRHHGVHVPVGRRRAPAGARDGEGSRREPRGGLGARQVHGRLPREPDEGDPRQDEGPGAEARDDARSRTRRRSST